MCGELHISAFLLKIHLKHEHGIEDINENTVTKHDDNQENRVNYKLYYVSKVCRLNHFCRSNVHIRVKSPKIS